MSSTAAAAAVELLERRAECLARGIDQHRPDAFATRQRAVTHGFEQPVGGAAIDFERARQHRFDALLVLRDSGRQETRRAGARDFSARRCHRHPRRRLVVGKRLDGFLAVARQQHFDFLLRRAQRRLALTRERHAALESLERFLEGHVALFEFRHQCFEFGQRLLEVGEFLILDFTRGTLNVAARQGQTIDVAD